MSLSKDGKIINSTLDLELISGDRSYLSLTSHSRGVRYFEFSHKSGSGAFAIGYISQSGGEVACGPISNFPQLSADATSYISLKVR